MKQAVAYIRKSTFGTDESGTERQEGSYDRQRSAIVDYARRNELEIVKWYEEPVSGKSIRKRKIFLQLVKDAKLADRGFEHIIFGEYDRFMRHVKEAMRHEVELDDAGIKLHFTNLKNDGSTADQIYKSIVREMAAEYSRELARKVIQGMYRKAKKGSWLGGVAPYGFKTHKTTDSSVSLIIFEEQAQFIRKMFELSLQGWGHKRIARWLNENNVPTSEMAQRRNSFRNRNFDGRWSGEVVRYILRNPIYKGEFRWNRRARVDCFDWKVEGQGTVEIGKLRTELKNFHKTAANQTLHENMKFYIDRTKTNTEWVVTENVVPPIVLPDVFDRAQQRFKTYRTKAWNRINDYKYLMSSALKCGSCGNRMSGHRYSKFEKATGKQNFYYYYRCQGDVKKGTHAKSNRPMIKQYEIDNYVISGIKDRINQLIEPEEVLRLFKSQMSQFVNTEPSRLVELDKAISTVEKEIDRIIYAHTKFDRPLPEDEVNELKSKKDSLKREKDFLTASGKSDERFDVDKQMEIFLNKMKDAQRNIEVGNAQDRIRIREGFLPRAEINWYTDEQATIDLYWNKLPEGLPSSDRRPTSTIFNTFQDEEEDLEVERYVYQKGQLIRQLP